MRSTPASTKGNGLAQSGHGHRSRARAQAGRPSGHKTIGDPGAAAAILISSCALTVVVWSANPFAGLLLVPALHLWMGALAPEPEIRPAVRILLLVLGFVLPALLVAYYAVTLGLAPVDLAWTGVLMLAGGQLGIPAAVLLCLLMGCAVSVAVNALATSRAQLIVPPAIAPITVRGPATYAGPGSLGGTESALPHP